MYIYIYIHVYIYIYIYVYIFIYIYIHIYIYINDDWWLGEQSADNLDVTLSSISHLVKAAAQVDNRDTIGAALVRSYLTQRIHSMVPLKSIYPQNRQLILYHFLLHYVDGFVGQLTYEKPVD